MARAKYADEQRRSDESVNMTVSLAARTGTGALFRYSRRRSLLRLSLPLAFGFLVCAPLMGASAAPYDPDAAWGTNGRVVAAAGSTIGNAHLQTNGGIVLVRADGLRRLRPDGTLDVVFGGDGTIGAPLPALVADAFALHPDGRLNVIWRSEDIWTLPGGSVVCTGRRWMRYSSAGDVDVGFGGSTGVPGVGPACSDTGMVLDRSANAYWIASTVWVSFMTVSVLRASASGVRLPDLDTVTQDNSNPRPWVPFGLAIDARERVVASARQDGSYGFSVIRYDGSDRDSSFGTAGIAYEPTARYVAQKGALPLPDGRVLAHGIADVGGRAQLVLARFTSEGVTDPSFGTGGVAAFAVARPSESLESVTIALDPAGRIVVAARVTLSGKDVTRVGRLQANGSPDLRFAGAGVSPVTFGLAYEPSLAVRPTGEIVLGLEREVVQLRGGDLIEDHGLRERLAVEYFHAGYGHYFVTADEDEQVVLDEATDRAWLRTGKAYTVYDATNIPYLPLAPVCRFWSGQSFAPKSSHFYTPYADECVKVMQDTAWLYERNAFYVRMPEGAEGARTCPTGTQPLYRAYNQGIGGAPNHRYTTDPAVLDAMIALGWVMEGEAATRVFACVPLQN